MHGSVYTSQRAASFLRPNTNPRDPQPKQAGAVYRADLARNPHNGWALTGLAQAWSRADIKPVRTAF